MSKLALQIERYELTNGLRVVLVQDPRAPEVQVTMRYQVGGVDDPPAQRGLAHLVEHLMFQQMVGERAIFARLQDHASAFNGFTTLDATTYVARARPERLGELLSIDAIRLGLRCASITDATFERERQVVINEQRLRASAVAVVGSIHEGLFPAGHPYRDWVGGTEESVGSVTRAQACAFADARYASKNAVLVVSGPVTDAQVHAALGKFFARIPARPAAAPAQIARTTSTGQTTVRAPIDDEVIIVAWPLPDDLALRSRMRALSSIVQAAVDGEVAGRVEVVELGGERDPLLALAVTTASDESSADAVGGIRRGLALAPGLLRTIAPSSTTSCSIARSSRRSMRCSPSSTTSRRATRSSPRTSCRDAIRASRSPTRSAVCAR